MARVDRSERVGFFQQAIDSLFGYDFFVSYSHVDGKNYPKTLKAALQAVGFRVFLDQTEYVAGHSLIRETRRQVRKSSVIVVVARQGALRSEWVLREVQVALEAQRTPVLIDINQAVATAGEDAELARLARTKHWLRLNETLPGNDSEASPYAVSELVRTFKATRQDTKRVRVLAAVSAVFATMAVVAGFAAAEANRQRAAAEAQERMAIAEKNRAEKTLAAATGSANNLVFNLADQFRGLTGVRNDFVKAILENARSLQKELTSIGNVTPDLKHSEAVALIQLSRALTDARDLKGARDAAGEAVKMLKDLAAASPGNSDHAAMLVFAHEALGNALEADNQNSAGLAEIQQAAAVARALATNERDSPRRQSLLASQLSNIGASLSVKGDHAAAIAAMAEPIALYERLHAHDPFHREYAFQLAGCYRQLSTTLRQAGRVDEAVVALDKAIAVSVTFAGINTLDVSQRMELAQLHATRGQTLAVVHQRPQAIDAYRSGLAIYQKLLQEDPAQPEFRRQVVWVLGLLADAHEQGNEHLAAYGYWRDSIASLRLLPPSDQQMFNLAAGLRSFGTSINSLFLEQEKWKEAIEGYDVILATIKHFNIAKDDSIREIAKTANYTRAKALKGAGRYDEAADGFAEALETSKARYNESPNDIHLRHALVFNYESLAETLQLAKRESEALPHVQAAAMIAEGLAREVPTDGAYQWLWRKTYLNIIATLTTLGRAQEAAQYMARCPALFAARCDEK